MHTLSYLGAHTTHRVKLAEHTPIVNKRWLLAVYACLIYWQTLAICYLNVTGSLWNQT